MEKDRNERTRAARNQTLRLYSTERERYIAKTLQVHNKATVEDITDKTIHQDFFEVVDLLPQKFIDLLFVDPPYNLDKTFNSTKFSQMDDSEYERWLESWLQRLMPALKPDSSVYICGDWRSSSAIFRVMSKYFHVRNRVTWEREKGRGAMSNWKNCAEDIWFGTVSHTYYFNSDAVKLKRRVIAPYKDKQGIPKDWEVESDGNYRLTYPSNLWTDITIPFWSMPENTDHPTQKPEKLLAKIILASTKEGGFVFDPFSGSGTTSVVARKLGRKYCGVEIDELFACLTEKRLNIADIDRTIQGYAEGTFYERNALNASKPVRNINTQNNIQELLLAL